MSTAELSTESQDVANSHTEKNKKEEDDNNGTSIQHTAALCFGIFFVAIGIPLWWKTTEVYRVSLPYSDIQLLSEKKIEYLTEVKVIWAAGEKKNGLELSDLAFHLNKGLGSKSSTGASLLSPLYRVAVRDAEQNEVQAIQRASKVSDLSTLFPSSQLHTYNIIVTKSSELLSRPIIAPSNNIFLPYNNAGASGLSDQVIQLLKDMVRSAAVSKSLDVANNQQIQRPDKDSMRAFRYHSGFDVTFTLMVPEPDMIDVRWDIEGGLDAYLQPLFSSLDSFTQFTITSQVLYFAGLGGKPKKEGDYYYFEERDLPLVINPLESKLGSHASNNPSLNFITCIPSIGKSPLHIKDSAGALLKSDAFLSPRWGGVMIYNIESARPSSANQTRPTVDLDMHKVMEVFVAQTRLLLDIQTQMTTKEALVLSSKSAELHQWEVAAWLRSRCVENLATSTATLRSLAQLLEEIGNIVINDEIGREVVSAVASIKSSHSHLATGRLREAFLASKDALRASELAFFHPSLLELLYFPEDQKFAIYIPLFLPISIPVLTSTVQAIKWFRQKRKAKVD